MKQLVIFSILLCSSLVLSAQDNKAVKNHLKSVSVFEQKFDAGTAGKVLPESVVRYDEAGNVIEEIEYKLGKITRHTTYKYDSNGNKIQEIELDASGKKIKTSVYKYYNNLRMEKTVYDANNKAISKKTYQYESY
jgi:hypothetical protein